VAARLVTAVATVAAAVLAPKEAALMSGEVVTIVTSRVAPNMGTGLATWRGWGWGVGPIFLSKILQSKKRFKLIDKSFDKI